MKKQFFNLIEIALAIAIIAVGMSSVLVLFPAGLNAVNSAYAAYSGQNVDGMSGATEQATAAKEEKCDTEAAKTCGGDCEHGHK